MEHQVRGGECARPGPRPSTDPRRRRYRDFPGTNNRRTLHQQPCSNLTSAGAAALTGRPCCPEAGGTTRRTPDGHSSGSASWPGTPPTTRPRSGCQAMFAEFHRTARSRPVATERLRAELVVPQLQRGHRARGEPPVRVGVPGQARSSSATDRHGVLARSSVRVASTPHAPVTPSTCSRMRSA